MMNLNSKQLKFVQGVLKGLSHTDAYRQAGYKVKSDESARSAAYQILTNIDVQKAIEAGRAKMQEKAEINAAWVLDRLVRNANRAAQAEPITDAQGNPTGQYTYQGNVVNKSLELIGKQIGMFRPDAQVQINAGGQVTIYLPEKKTVDE